MVEAKHSSHATPKYIAGCSNNSTLLKLMSGPSNNSEIQIKSGPQNPEFSIKLLSAMRSVLCQPAVPLRHPKLKAPTNTVYLLSLAEPNSFQTTPIKRTSMIKGGLNNKVFIITQTRATWSKLLSRLGDLELEKCYKYYMRVKPTMSMKKVNLFCYQNTAQFLLAKDGSCIHLCQSEGSKQGPPFNSGFHLLIYGHMACGILFPQQAIEPGPSGA